MADIKLFTPDDLQVFGQAQQTMQKISEIKNAMEKSMIMVDATTKVREILSKPEVISKIMPLQNKPYGFLTDRKQNGYGQEEVLDCLTEATMQGVSFANNEFNIIAGKCYIAKNGMRSKLNYLPIANFVVKFDDYNVSRELVKVPATISWTDTETNIKHKEQLHLIFRFNKTDSPDNLFGKGKRKAYAWLFERYTGTTVDDGDASDVMDITEMQQSEPTQIGKPEMTDEALSQVLGYLSDYKISVKSAISKAKAKYKVSKEQISAIEKAGEITTEKLLEICEIVGAGTRTIESFKFILDETQIKYVEEFISEDEADEMPENDNFEQE